MDRRARLLARHSSERRTRRRLDWRRDTIATGDAFTTSYGYTDRDALHAVTYPSGRAVRYTRDVADRIVAVTDVTDPQQPVAYATGPGGGDITYHPNGVVGEYVAGNGLTHSVALDSRQRIATIDAAPLALTYTCDDVGITPYPLPFSLPRGVGVSAAASPPPAPAPS